MSKLPGGISKVGGREGHGMGSLVVAPRGRRKQYLHNKKRKKSQDNIQTREREQRDRNITVKVRKFCISPT
jgi:hypothetical protein